MGGQSELAFYVVFGNTNKMILFQHNQPFPSETPGRQNILSVEVRRIISMPALLIHSSHHLMESISTDIFIYASFPLPYSTGTAQHSAVCTFQLYCNRTVVPSREQTSDVL